MIDWILNNKEWIFSGIGILVIGIVIKFFSWVLSNKKKRQEQINEIVERYISILDGKISGHTGILGLIEAGAAQLKRNKDLLVVIDKIASYGKPYPLHNWFYKYIEKSRVLNFIKWQTQNKINHPDYFYEGNFAKLIERYNKSSK